MVKQIFLVVGRGRPSLPTLFVQQGSKDRICLIVHIRIDYSNITSHQFTANQWTRQSVYNGL